MLKDSLVNVSPPTGTREVRVTRSTFKEPITDITAGLEGILDGVSWCRSFLRVMSGGSGLPRALEEIG
jgi:hypothetical protein